MLLLPECCVLDVIYIGNVGLCCLYSDLLMSIAKRKTFKCDILFELMIFVLAFDFAEHLLHKLELEC